MISVEMEGGAIKSTKLLSDSEVAAMSAEEMLGGSVAKTHPIQVMVQRAVDDVSSSFEKNLKKIAFRAVGFEEDYGNSWRIDHCNGRMSAVTDFVCDFARNLFKSLNLKSVEDVLSEKDLKDIKKLVSDEIKSILHHEVRTMIYPTLKIFVQDLASKQMEKHQQYIESVVTEAISKEIGNEEN